MDLAWLVSLLHAFPHYNFTFRETSAVFDPSSMQYLQAISLWSLGVCALGAVLCVVVLITWCVRCCCSRPKEPAKRLTKIRNLSSGLFVVSVACFAWLGLALFSNERVNRGLSSTADALADLGTNIQLAVQKVGMVNRTLNHNVSSLEIGELAAVLGSASGALNDTEKERIGALMKNVSDSVDAAIEEAVDLRGALANLDSLRPAAERLFRIENERWITFAILLSIMLVVLFGGVVGFCRHSKKAAVLFSGLGLVLFLLAWLLVAVVLGAGVALGDFCADPEPFLLAQFSGNRSREMTKFFVSCREAKEGQPESLPPPFKAADASIRGQMSSVESGVGELATLSAQLFAPDIVGRVEAVKGNVSAAVAACAVELTKTEQLLSCSGSLRRDYRDAHDGVCATALSGAGLGLIGLALLGFSLFLLLVCLSKAWHLYTKRPMDYVEVEDEDPFLPRGSATLAAAHDSTIPPDFYGSHVYNPRTRFASNGDSDTGLASGEGATPLWSRTAPPPPAYDVVGNGHGRYRQD